MRGTGPELIQLIHVCVVETYADEGPRDAGGGAEVEVLVQAHPVFFRRRGAHPAWVQGGVAHLASGIFPVEVGCHARGVAGGGDAVDASPLGESAVLVDRVRCPGVNQRVRR